VNATQTTALDLSSAGNTSDVWTVMVDAYAKFSAAMASGSWGSAIVRLEGSLDKTTWTPTGISLSAAGISGTASVQPYNFARLYVVSPQSGAKAKVSLWTWTADESDMASLAALQTQLNAKRDKVDFSCHCDIVTISMAALAGSGSTLLTRSYITAGSFITTDVQGNNGLLDQCKSSADAPGAGSVTIRAQRQILTLSRNFPVVVQTINIPGL